MPDIRVTVPNEFNFIVPTSTDFPLAVDGLGSLIQLVYKNLLTTPGRDIFNTQYGAGIASILPTAANRSTRQAVASDISVAILKAEEDIKRFQSTSGDRLTSDETLDSLSLVSFDFDPSQALWILEISVTTRAGISALIGIDINGSAVS